MTPPTQIAPTRPRWDYYAASIPLVSPEEIIDSLVLDLGGEIRATKPINGYRQAVEIRHDDRRSAMVLWGGHNPDVHALSSGQDSEPFAAALRALSLHHRVSRADVCVDIDAPGAFETLSAALRAAALQSGIQMQLITDPDRPERGRTLYVGSRKSRGFVRLYEKGRKDDPSRPDWVRFEVEIKPNEPELRAHLAALAPLDALGMVRWVRSFVGDQFDFAAAAAPIRLPNVGDDERSMEAMLNQYGRLLRRTAQRTGGWETLGRDLGRRLTGEEPR